MADQSLQNAGFISAIDQALGDFLAQWNTASTIIVGLLMLVFLYPIFTSKEPDTHPFLLARQANQSPIRQEGQSAVYRSTEIPYGYPLRSGLAIKDPEASKWAAGRDGDLRDVWRQANNDTKSARIITILGTNHVEHDLKILTQDINSLGRYLSKTGSERVAVCLSNSVELLCTIFAGSFYGFSPILLPYSQVPDETKQLLASTVFDTLIAEAGSVALNSLLQHNKNVRRIIWVTKAGSKHLDWNEVPEGAGGKLDVSTWNDMLDEQRLDSPKQVLPLEQGTTPPPVLIFCETRPGQHELVEYSQQNLIAGVAALQSSLPRLKKLQATDTVLSTVAMTNTYALCWSWLTLFTGATLVLNSVAGPHVDILTITRSARESPKPTHVVVDARAVPKFLGELSSLMGGSGLPAKYAAWKLGRAISQGYLPESSAAQSYLPPALGKLKALHIAQQAVLQDSERLRSETLSQLRLALGTRTVLALTSSQVAGPVTQTNFFDYRDKGNVCCVGAVAASLELHLVGAEEEMQKDSGVGVLTVRGPAAVGSPSSNTSLSVRGKIDGDNTVILV